MKTGTFAFILLIPAMFLQAFALQVLWVWFIAPQFSLAPLALYSAMGLVLVVSFLKNDLLYSKNIADYYQQGLDVDTASTVITDSFVYPLLSILIGWVIHLGV